MTTDVHQELNISATTSEFTLQGGMYGVDYKATWGGGSVTLQKLAADATTWLTALTAFSADGCTNGWLPLGRYRLLVATATAIYVNISRIPFQG